MKAKKLELTANDGVRIIAYKWAAKRPKAVVQIAHGAIEHAMRYDHFANHLAKSGFSVYADDHRGHGQTAGGVENVPYLGDGSGRFSHMVDDMHTLTKRIKQENPGLPVFLLGHSMGAAMSRIYASRHGEELQGLVLTGTGRVAPPLIAIVRALARCQMALLGPRHRSKLLHTVLFGTLNRPFEGDTGSEFICSDPAVVEAYAADELCGNETTAAFAYELLWGIGESAKKSTFAKTPKNLPVFVGAGEMDTMGGAQLKAVRQDVADYQKAGIGDLTFKMYPGMRHEILNETEKQTVYGDIAEWITQRV